MSDNEVVTECRIFSHLFPSGTCRVNYLEPKAACGTKNSTKTDEKRFYTPLKSIYLVNKEQGKKCEQVNTLRKCL